MPEVIALVSKSKRLLISLDNEDCDFSIANDRSTLLFEKASPGAISSINFELSTNQQAQIHLFTVPCYASGREGSVRIDALFPFVFEDSEPIESVIAGYPSFLAGGDSSVFTLRVVLNFDGALTPPTVTRINSASLATSSTAVPVSKEALGASSDFFLKLFYVDFMEKDKESFCINDVDEKEFNLLIDSVMERKWNAISVDQALTILALADRFCMYNVVKRIVPFIKNTQLDENPENRMVALKHYVDLATRCRDIGAFVCWILERCETAAELTELAQSCAAALTPHLEIFFRCLAFKQLEERMKSAEERETMEREKKALAEEKEQAMREKREALDVHLRSHVCMPRPSGPPTPLSLAGPTPTYAVPTPSGGPTPLFTNGVPTRTFRSSGCFSGY